MFSAAAPLPQTLEKIMTPPSPPPESVVGAFHHEAYGSLGLFFAWSTCCFLFVFCCCSLCWVESYYGGKARRAKRAKEAIRRGETYGTSGKKLTLILGPKKSSGTGPENVDDGGSEGDDNNLQQPAPHVRKIVIKMRAAIWCFSCFAAIFLCFVATFVSWQAIMGPFYEEGGGSPPTHVLVVAIVVPASVGSVWVLLASCCCLLFNFFDEGTRLLLERAARIDSEVEDCLAAGDIRLIDCEWLRRNRNVFDVADDEPNAGHNLAAGEVAEKRDGESGVSAGSVAATAVAAPTTRRRMMRMQDLIRAHPDALLPPERAHSLYKRVRMRRSALERIYVLSYAWRTPLHPDPDGHTLENVLRFLDHAHDAMAAQLTSPREGHDEGGSDGDAPLPPEPELPEAALFWDFCSLPQKGLDAEPRSEEELHIFRRALGVMGNLYGSLWATTVLRSRSVPPRPRGFVGEYNDMPYDRRGWPSFERFAAELAVAHRLADSYFSHTEVHRPKLIDIAGATPLPARLAEPPSTNTMVKHLKTVHFTGGSESGVRTLALLPFFSALP